MNRDTIRNPHHGMNIKPMHCNNSVHLNTVSAPQLGTKNAAHMVTSTGMAKISRANFSNAIQIFSSLFIWWVLVKQAFYQIDWGFWIDGLDIVVSSNLLQPFRILKQGERFADFKFFRPLVKARPFVWMNSSETHRLVENAACRRGFGWLLEFAEDF